MARPTKEEQLRKRTKSTILQSLENRGMSEQYLLDQVEVYMEYYDNLIQINELLRKSFDIKLSCERRQIEKEMLNILQFLGLKPSEVVVSQFEEL